MRNETLLSEEALVGKKHGLRVDLPQPKLQSKASRIANRECQVDLLYTVMQPPYATKGTAEKTCRLLAGH